MDEVGFKFFSGIGVFLIAFPVEIAGIEIPQFFQTEGPDGDVVYAHRPLWNFFLVLRALGGEILFLVFALFFPSGFSQFVSAMTSYGLS